MGLCRNSASTKMGITLSVGSRGISSQLLMNKTTEVSAYEELVAAIVKAVPQIRRAVCTGCTSDVHAERCPNCPKHFVAVSLRPITVEDVLRAIHKSQTSPIGVCTSGEFLDCDDECNNLRGIDIRWHFGHSLEWHRDNAPETIAFLHSVICS